jgi:UDP-3-O-[3-hydroxymyristoyl] N-acetylglucosamine deacetylase/3-hydroxyacyl-[acyl-carrier-protein] dehydratase
MSETRRSIGSTARVTGTGLHTGVEATATLSPAPPGSGIVFRRADLADAPDIPARLTAVHSTERRLVLGNAESNVGTVEHLLAAAVGLGIDDLLVEVDGPELPAGDGSALLFAEALDAAGAVEQEGTAHRIVIRAPFTVHAGDTRYLVAPSDGLHLTVAIDFDHAAVGRQATSVEVSRERFVADLAGARTFGFREELTALQERGLALGASTGNALALEPDGTLSAALRWPDEFARHKALDLLGDLALLGGRLSADIVAVRPGHTRNVDLARSVERTAQATAPPVMGIQEILGVLPHRYPFLLVDRIVHSEPGKRIVGIKNVTMNEPFFPGHFPDHPVMPGVLIVEAMAQTGGMLLMGQVDDPEGKIVYFMSIDDVKFRKPVIPGDQLRFELEMLRFRGKTCHMQGIAYVDGQPVAEAKMMAAIVDR